MGLHRRQQRIEFSRAPTPRPPPARRRPASRRTARRSAHRALALGRQKQRGRICPAAAAAAGLRDASRPASGRWPRPLPARARSGCGRAASGARRKPDRAAPVPHAALRRRRAPAVRARASRISGGIGGTADSPRVSALKYRPEPPMKIGSRFCRARLRQHSCRHRPPRRRRKNSPRRRHGHRAGAAPAPPPPASAAP